MIDNHEPESSGIVESLRKTLHQNQMNSLNERFGRISRAHGQYLDIQSRTLQHMARLISMQIPGGREQHAALFDAAQLAEFASGDITRCLGADYAEFNGRRIPRIPNGDLLLMSRVMQINGKRLDFDQPASIRCEYDVPVDAWFLRDNATANMPYSVYMEIALQPCGFLSAYLGSLLLYPDADFYFRNLDGEGKVLRKVDLAGKTISGRAELVSALISSETIIQKYRFDLSVGGEIFYEGESTFGYFSPQSMERQAGLDGGRSSRPDMLAGSNELVDIGMYTIAASGSYLHLPQGQMSFLQKVLIHPAGGRFGHGSVYAKKDINPADWFYRCHFYQDPVMPGSLGVEAVLQAMQAYALRVGLGDSYASANFFLPDVESMVWKYRGQITPAHKTMELEVHITDVKNLDGETIVTGDASVWVDGIRIYEIKRAAIGLREG
jgi:3-hydroxymyristoyl/3-hydroxydecanoyl-(acyl carrier protein) dehydratase